MENQFDFLTMDFFTRAEIYPGSLGAFRYRFQREGRMDDGALQAWVYENICFELAKDIETATFPWTEKGVAALRRWLAERYAVRGGEPYRIPDPPAQKQEDA